jgi:hypothetical protein
MRIGFTIIPPGVTFTLVLAGVGRKRKRVSSSHMWHKVHRNFMRILPVSMSLLTAHIMTACAEYHGQRHHNFASRLLAGVTLALTSVQSY